MAIGRISGSVLKSNLTRNGVDLAFETNLLYLDVTNSRIGIGTSEPTTTLDVAGTVKATAFTGDGSGLTGINVNTNIQIVGDDSTGAILGTGETFKIAGGNNITTAVSGDTLTVTGSKDINVNSITSDDSTAIQINDNINIAGNILPTTTLTYNLGSTDYRFNELWLAGTTIDLGGTKLSVDGSGDFEIKDSGGNRKNVVADSVLIGSGASKIKLSRGNNGKLKFTDENDTDTAILTIVGDDSTGVDLNSGETIKIAGAGGVTTAVSGDTLTITGPTGTLSNLVEDTTPQLGGSLDVNGNSIISTSNGNIVLDPDGTGVIQVNASIIPETTLTYSLGSPTKKFQDAYFGAGTVYIGDQSITSTASGLVFSSVTTDNTTDDDTAIVFSKSGIRSTAKTIESFDSSSADSALYFTVYRDESNDQNQVQKISLVHDTASAYHSTSGIVVSGSANSPTFTSDLNGGSVQLKVTGTTEANSIKGYKISLGDNSTSGTSGHTAVITPGSVAESFASVIDSWSNSSYRAAKYFISAKNTSTGSTNNIEAVVLHDGSNAYLNIYNVVKTNPDANDLISLSAAYNGSNIELSAQSNGNSIRVIMHRILLSSDETAAEYTNIKIVDEQTISSASTVIDTFNTTKLSGALYFVTASNDTSGYYAAGEAYVVTDGTDAYVAIGPNLSSNDAFSVEYSATLSGNIVNFKASASIDSATKITAYRIGLLEAQATGDFSSTVTLDTAQTITGNKTFNGTLTANNPISLSVTSDPAGVTDRAHIYAKDEASSAEVFVRDEAGNVTKISPHNEAGEWEYYSRNTKTGKVVRVNMEEMIRDLEKLTGKTYIKNQ